jgi:hypothetical protein
VYYLLAPITTRQAYLLFKNAKAMAKQLMISLPDKHFDTFMGLFKQFKIKVEIPKKKALGLSKEQKKILDERVNQYFKNPSDVTEWDTFMKELKNEI